MPARLDAIDRKILKELQDDGRMTNVELARRVGISAPPCLRRVRGLEEAGYIKGYRALLDEKKLGYEVTVFAMVHLASQAEADLAAFEEFVRAQPLVRECWMLSGEIDFVFKCVAPDLKTFQAFVEKLTAAPNVRNVKTSLTLRNSKDAAMVPMDEDLERKVDGMNVHASNGSDTILIEKDVEVPMRDGARLMADVFRPQGEAKVPAILNLGPYQKDKLWVVPDTLEEKPNPT